VSTRQGSQLPPPRLRPLTARWEEHVRYESELLPQVAAVLGLPPATAAALAELDRRAAVEGDRIRPPEVVRPAFAELEAARRRAKRRVLGDLDAVNRFETALSAAYNGTLTVLPPPVREDLDSRFDIVSGDYGVIDPATPPTNRYDALFADVGQGPLVNGR
jgi:hypothetical protein